MSTKRPRWRSRLRIVDLVAESWLEVTRRPTRAVITGLGVALGAATIVATLTLVATIRFQVSDRFDARRATQVELRGSETFGGGVAEVPFPPDSAAIQRIEGLSGVQGVAVVRETREEQAVAINQVVDPTTTQIGAHVFGLNAGSFATLEAKIRGPGWNAWHDRHSERVVVLSRQTAASFGGADISVGDRVFVAGLGFTVVGILEQSPRLPGLMDGIVVPVTTVEMFELDDQRDRLIVVTAPGAAQQVAAALPLALTPATPDMWVAYAPEDDAQLRRAIDDQLQALSLGLGGIVLVLGVVSISNATLTSVVQRINEIGLRRALGARPRHIVAHVLLDAATIGTIGGLLGTIVGLTATLTVTASQGWVPVIDPWIPPATIAGGLLAGGLAGIYPARIGARLQPTDALRRE